MGSTIFYIVLVKADLACMRVCRFVVQLYRNNDLLLLCLVTKNHSPPVVLAPIVTRNLSKSP